MIALRPTFRQLVARAGGLFTDAGIGEPRREALALVSGAAGLSSGEVVLHGDREAPPDLEARVGTLAARRAAGEPLAYVVGRVAFRHLELDIDQRVLIPRPETEQLVEEVLRLVRHGRLVDVGTGSGCLALSLCTEGRFEQVTGIDLSADALAVAHGNAERLGQRVRWLQGDLLQPVREECFVAVVANPPYLSEAEYAVLDPAVRDWEPAVALRGGPDGLDFYRRLVTEAAGVLDEAGVLAMEVDCSRAADVAVLARAAGWRDVAVIEDLFGRDRFVTARRGTRHD